jgi:uncharacterized membrane protein YkgB
MPESYACSFRKLCKGSGAGSDFGFDAFEKRSKNLRPYGVEWVSDQTQRNYESPFEERQLMSATTLERQTGAIHSAWVDRIESVGRQTVRYGLVLVLLWIGAMKFTAYEAEGISTFVSHSSLMSWAYQVFSIRQFSVLLGVSELLIAGLIAARPFSAKVSAVGSALAAGMFLTTLSFLFSTPGVVESSLGFPALSALPGQFLVKDVVLLGAAVWTTGEALRAVRHGHTMRYAQ